MFRKLFPNFRRAKRGYKDLLADHAQPELRDRPPAQAEEINLASKKYYESAEQIPYWENKPFSDTEEAPWLLWRFGVLMAGLRLIPGIRILDFGCGTGWASVMMAQMGADVVGMDIAQRAIDIATGRADRFLNAEQRSRCAFAVFEGKELQFHASSFDIVFLFEALHHLPNPLSLLKEFARVLSQHGRLGFAEPGLGHEHHEHSVEEMKHGILEQDLELDQVFRAGMTAGFRELEVLIQGIHPGIFSLPMEQVRWYLRGASWLVPADFIRQSIVSGPIGIFTKSPYAMSTLNPLCHRAEISSGISEISVPANTDFSILVKTRNPSETVWLAQTERGRGLVTLGASLLLSDKSMLRRDFGRAGLPHDVGTSQEIDLQIKLRSPEKPGKYIVRLDMVNEGVCWFADKGSRPADIHLIVS
jgi:2-polyprenyl-3-methyl-5-hydroxy-6-metoxy-1,4-benzoquinol methylase